MLRPAVSRPISLGDESHLGCKTKLLLLLDICCFVDVERAVMLSMSTASHVRILNSRSVVKSPVPCGIPTIYSSTCNLNDKGRIILVLKAMKTYAGVCIDTHT
jgi:hypothetical protein